MATTAKSLIAEAQTQGIPVSIDVSSVGAVSDFGLSRYAELLHDLQPDILFTNAAEDELLASEEGLISQSSKSKSPNPAAALSETFQEFVSQSPKGKSPNPQSDLSNKHSKAQTNALLLSLAKVILINQGPNPVILLSRDPLAQKSPGSSQTKLEIPVSKLEKVTDTLAAGDTFTAGFLVAKTINNLSLQETTTAAINVAADLLQRRNQLVD